MISSVDLAQRTGNRKVFPMALLGWAWKLKITATNFSSMKWFVIHQPAVSPDVGSVQGSKRKVDSFLIVAAFSQWH